MPVRSRLVALRLALVVIAAVSPVLTDVARADAPVGTMTVGVHVTLVSRWLDPGETEALITPFMVLYLLHDALV